MHLDSDIEIPVRVLNPGFAQGKALTTSQRIALLQGVDPETGKITDRTHELYGKTVASTILVYPNSIGSSVGSYVLYRLSKNKMSPHAIVNEKSDIITVSGCAIANIPLVDVLVIDDFEKLLGYNGKMLTVDPLKSVIIAKDSR
jgi:predicted aconitase with swiveling domain